MDNYLICDFETRSTVDIGSCGSYKYMEDKDFRPLLLAYAFGDEGEVKLVDFTAGETWPEEFLSALHDPQVTKVAWNCAFEREVIHQALGYTDPEAWLDVMHIAAQCGLPMSLDAAGRAIGLSEEQAKMKEGKALIRFFCIPRRPTKADPDSLWNEATDHPDKWQTFKDYCVRDVESERTIFKLLRRWMPNDEERRFFALDQRINDKGVRIDRRLAANAVQMDSRYKEELTEQAVALTGMQNPKSVSQIKTWLRDQEGKEFPSLNKKVIADVVSALQTDEAREFMAIRAELAKSSTAKYTAMLHSACKDDHCKGCFQFYGANRTGRFAGRLVQFQNMSKNYSPDLDGMRQLVRDGHYTALKFLYDGVADPLSQLVRTAILPEDGQKLLISDFSAIEARVTAWFADEEWRLKAFREGKDIYCESASQMFHVPVVKHGINGELRQKGKVAELALGYGGGVNALKAFGADKMGMPDEEMQETVDLWRESSPKIVALWRSLEKAAIRAVARRTSTISDIGNVLFDFEDGVLFMTLPSGRRIAYWGASYEESVFHPDRKSLTYMGVEQQTRKWARLETWGGKLVENCWAAGTPVLTDRGWAPIETVSQDDLVWDGTSWARTLGSECEHRADVLFELDGLLVTGDHKILTTEGWVNAKDCDGLDRLQVQLPDRDRADGGTGRARATEVAGALRLRAREKHGHPGHPGARESRTPDLLRLHEEGLYLRREYDPRHDGTQRLRRLAFHDTALYRALTSGLEKLRRTWDHGLRPLEAQLREFLGGHGGLLRTGKGPRPDRQRSRILAGELPMGDTRHELPKQARRPKGNDLRENGPTNGAGTDNRDRVHDPAVQAGPRLSVRQADRPAGHPQPVYDVINCGPRHRYVVLGANGPILVHNCVQATARDCLREAMLALDEAGFDIRAHVHDEVIVTEPLNGRSVNEMSEIMGQEIKWAPGLPLRADGYEGKYYYKD